MKSFFSRLIFIFLTLNAFALVPPSLTGIWEGKDRYLFIGENGDFSVILKLYNGWYFDRFSESSGFETKSSRERNAASSSNPVIVKADFEKISNLNNLNAYEILLYEKNQLIQKIPLSVSEEKIYLKFWIKIPEEKNESGINGKEDENTPETIQNENPENKKTIYGYWQAINTAENIRISEIKRNESIYSYFILPDAIYRLRFWKTDMNFDGETKAAFTDDENIFRINRHIFSGNATFTCTSGRSVRIRNVQEFSELPFEYELDESGFILREKKTDFIKFK